MAAMKKLLLIFFEKSRPNAPKKSLEKTKPFKWSNEKKVLNSNYKNDIIIELPQSNMF